jgi:hypothetical protein
MQHTSLQFSDNADQQEHDIRALFEEGEAFPIKTGTEAGKESGPSHNYDLLQEYADRYNHVLNIGGDSWVAVDKDIIVPRSVVKEDIFLVSNDDMVGHGHNRVMPTISFEHVKPGVGRIHQGSVHYPTQGAQPGDPNHDLNRICAERISKWLAKVAVGADLGFVNGDFNMPDPQTDWALGGNFTSMADELKAWQNSGHGPIDGFCSYDRDGRVTAKRFVVLDDREFKLFSDHFMCRGTWTIRLMEAS